MLTEAHRRANKKYNDKFDMISIRVPKGEPEMIKAHAEKMGELLVTFIRRAIRETMERDNRQSTT